MIEQGFVDIDDMLVMMDYDGEPVVIEEGEMLWCYPEEGEHWNPETCQFEPDEDDDDDYYGESLEELELRCWYYDRL